VIYEKELLLGDNMSPAGKRRISAPIKRSDFYPLIYEKGGIYER
jgi:hypothetical protein